MIDPNKLSLELKELYKGSACSAELVVYVNRDGIIFKEKITVDFVKNSDDYYYSTTTRPVQF
jgi:hypothetical protein